MERSFNASEDTFALSIRKERSILSLVFALVISKLAYPSTIFLERVLPTFLPSSSTNSAPPETDPASLYTSHCATFPKESRIRTSTVVFCPAMKILEDGVTSIFTGIAGRTVTVENPLIPF